MLSASRTVAALAIALFGTMGANILITTAIGDVAPARVRDLLIVAVLVAFWSGVAASVLVLPVLLLVPRLRTLPWWAAAVWGAGVAILVMLFIEGPSILRQSGGVVMASLGAASGVTFRSPLAFSSERRGRSSAPCGAAARSKGGSGVQKERAV